MIKTGVVVGTVKTASADNEGDPVGTAAKCIAAAKEKVAGLSAVAQSIRKSMGVKDEDKDKAGK